MYIKNKIDLDSFRKNDNKKNLYLGTKGGITWLNLNCFIDLLLFVYMFCGKILFFFFKVNVGKW